MKLTDEQQNIISVNENVKVNAVAGSGKTTTLIEYARSRPAKSRILYLAFNKSVKTEAEKKFSEKGLENVRVETAHSLALGYTFRGQRFDIKPAYKSHEIATLLRLEGGQEKHEQFILANHIRKYVSYFCNSDKSKVQDLDYRNVVFDPKARDFVDKYYERIELGTREFLAKMYNGRTAIIHDYYLKQFQLNPPTLPYDYILFDEGQDASGAMLDVFLKQDAVKVIVGDTHQQIYSWRYAINSLENVSFPHFSLSSSFRFNQSIAGLANEILGWKGHFKNHSSPEIKGLGGSGSITSRATIARTNLALLIKAIDFIRSNKDPGVYFEGNINSYTYADEGASIYDVYNLYFKNGERIKDPLIRSMKDIYELRDYIEKTEDRELAMILDVIDEYRQDLPKLLKRLKQCHTENKSDADMVFSTVHRSKGMEYDEVTLASDFISEEKLLKMIKEEGKENLNTAGLNEEVNLFYVAATRTKNILNIPGELWDEETPPASASGRLPAAQQPAEKENGSNIRIIRPAPKEETFSRAQKATLRDKPKVYTVAEKRKENKNAYQPWTPELDEELTTLFCEGWNEKQLASHFGRNPGAIRSRVNKLELYEKYR